MATIILTDIAPGRAATLCTCGKELNRTGAKFCSLKCFHQSKKKDRSEICECCGVMFERKKCSNSKTCSRKCWAKMRSIEYAGGKMLELAAKRDFHIRERIETEKRKRECSLNRCCGWCGGFFKAVFSNAMFCSDSNCVRDRKAGLSRSQSYWARPAVRVCNSCGKEYGRERSIGSSFCSEKCCRKVHKKLRQRRIESSSADKVGLLFVAKKYGYVCCDCGVKCVKPNGHNELHEATVDHIIPIVLGGTHTIHNLQLLCRSCNNKKGDKHPFDYYPPP